MLKHSVVCAALATAALTAMHYPRAEQIQASLGHRSSATELATEARCAEAAVHVTGASATERRLACSAANEVLQLLARCQIYPRRAPHIEISSDVRQPLGPPIFGLFDAKRQRAVVTRYAIMPVLVRGTPYSRVPQEEFYKSVVVHEVVHAVTHQLLKRPASSLAAYEYPAYALQIASLPPTTRDKFLRSFGQIAVGPGSLFTDSLLYFDPFFFAARAYRHYRKSANGCKGLAALLEGDAGFILATPH